MTITTSSGEPVYEVQSAPIRSGTAASLAAAGCGGFMAGIAGASVVSFVLTLFLKWSSEAASTPAMVVGAALAVWGAWTVFRGARNHSYRDGLKALRTQALQAMHDAREHAAALSRDLDGAERHLAEAQRCFAARLYGPFRDSIIAAAHEIEKSASSAAAVRQDESLYKHALAGAQHTFPDFDSLLTPADRGDTIRRYEELVRRAEADPGFASERHD